MTIETEPTATEADAAPSEPTPLRRLGERRGDTLSVEKLNNIPLDVEVVLGRTRMLFREVRALRVGAAFEVDRTRNEPVDILVNGQAFGKGEIVLVNENIGVRITEITANETELG